VWFKKSKWDIINVKKMIWHVFYTIGVSFSSLLHCGYEKQWCGGPYYCVVTFKGYLKRGVHNYFYCHCFMGLNSSIEYQSIVISPPFCELLFIFIINHVWCQMIVIYVHIKVIFSNVFEHWYQKTWFLCQCDGYLHACFRRTWLVHNIFDTKPTLR